MTTVDYLLFALQLFAALGCGLIAGVFFAFSTFVMPALAGLQPDRGIAAMQSINITAINPLFMSALFGTAIACLFIVIFALLHWDRSGTIYLSIRARRWVLSLVQLRSQNFSDPEVLRTSLLNGTVPLSAFLEYQADPRSLAFYDPNDSNPDRALALFELFQAWADERPRLNYQLAIARRHEPYAPIGCCGLRGMSFPAGEMELGLELAPTYWGRYAYAIEVGRALLDFGFGELQLDVISGSTVSANTRIAKLVEWMGAEVVAIRPGAAWMSDRGWSEVHWRIARSQWHRNLGNTHELNYSTDFAG